MAINYFLFFLSKINSRSFRSNLVLWNGEDSRYFYPEVMYNILMSKAQLADGIMEMVGNAFW